MNRKALMRVVGTLIIGLLIIGLTATPTRASIGDAHFVGTVLLGRPTDRSITVSVVVTEALEVTFEYGLKTGNYVSKTDVIKTAAGHPTVLVLSQLEQDTQYYYRMLYRLPGGSEFNAAEEHTFHTQRRPGSGFAFTVQADPHLDKNSDPEIYKRTLLNELNDHPDFVIDLGDTFMSEKVASTQQEVIDRYTLQRTYFGLLCHSAPLFLANGNHDGELGWLLDGTSKNVAVWATEARKMYFLNPAPDSFYTGDTVAQDFVGLREDYYAWEWGNALFVVLDPFWYTRTTPNQNDDLWSWTLGKEQYQWFGHVLESTSAQYKFVFSHHLLGTVRGGTRWAKYYEWGGENKQGTWGFDSRRPGWEMPIHQLMVKNQVTIFFQGHDHLFVKEELDGIVYQEVPQPSLGNLQNAATIAAEYGYSGYALPSSGYIRVTVSPSGVTVDYVRTLLPKQENANQRNGEVAYSYKVNSPQVATNSGTRTITPTTTTKLTQIPTTQITGGITATVASTCSETATEVSGAPILGLPWESIVAGMGVGLACLYLIDYRRRKKMPQRILPKRYPNTQSLFGVVAHLGLILRAFWNTS